MRRVSVVDGPFPQDPAGRILHFFPDEEDPAGIVARYRTMMATGSHLVVSHAGYAGPPEEVGPIVAHYRRTTAPLTMRTPPEIEALLDGFDLVAPGLVFMPLWHPDSPVDVGDHPERFGYATVGRRG